MNSVLTNGKPQLKQVDDLRRSVFKMSFQKQLSRSTTVDQSSPLGKSSEGSIQAFDALECRSIRIILPLTETEEIDQQSSSVSEGSPKSLPERMKQMKDFISSTTKIQKDPTSIFRQSIVAEELDGETSFPVAGHSTSIRFLGVMDQARKMRAILLKQPDSRTNNDIQFLQNVFRFKNDFFNIIENRFGLPTLRKVLRIVRLEEHEENSIVFAFNEFAEKIYVVLSGEICVFHGKGKKQQKNMPSNKSGFAVKITEAEAAVENEQKLGEVFTVMQSFGDIPSKTASSSEISRRDGRAIASSRTDLAVINKKEYAAILSGLKKEDTASKIHFLQTIPIFQKWEYDDLRKLSFSLNEVQLFKQNILFTQGQSATDLFIVKTGEFRVTRECVRELSDSHSGGRVVRMNKSLLICLSYCGEFLGEESLLQDSATRDFSVQCSSLEGIIYRINRQDLEGVCQNLSLHTTSGLSDLTELLRSKQKWRMQRHSEMHAKFQKSNKVLAASTSFHHILTNHLHIEKQESDSPNTMKLRAANGIFSIQAMSFTQEATAMVDEKNIAPTSSYRPSHFRSNTQIELPINDHNHRLVSQPCASSYTDSQIKNNKNHMREFQTSNIETTNSPLPLNQPTMIAVRQENPIRLRTKLSDQQQYGHEDYNLSAPTSVPKLAGLFEGFNEEDDQDAASVSLNQRNIEQSGITTSCERFYLKTPVNVKAPKVKNNYTTSLISFYKRSRLHHTQSLQTANEEPSSKEQHCGSIEHGGSLTERHKKSTASAQQSSDFRFDLQFQPASVILSKAEGNLSSRISSDQVTLQQNLKNIGINLSPLTNVDDTPQNQTTTMKKKNRLTPSVVDTVEDGSPSPQGGVSQKKPTNQESFLRSLRDRIKETSTIDQTLNQPQTRRDDTTLTVSTSIHNTRGNTFSFTAEPQSTTASTAVGFISDDRKLKKRADELSQFREKQFLCTMKSIAEQYKFAEMEHIESTTARSLSSRTPPPRQTNLIQLFAQQTSEHNKFFSRFTQHKLYADTYKMKEKMIQLKRKIIVNPAVANDNSPINPQQPNQQKNPSSLEESTTFNFSSNIKQGRKLAMVTRTGSMNSNCESTSPHPTDRSKFAKDSFSKSIFGKTLPLPRVSVPVPVPAASASQAQNDNSPKSSLEDNTRFASTPRDITIINNSNINQRQYKNLVKPSLERSTRRDPHFKNTTVLMEETLSSTLQRSVTSPNSMSDTVRVISKQLEKKARQGEIVQLQEHERPQEIQHKHLDLQKISLMKSRIDSVWDNKKNQLQFKRLLTYNP